MEIVEQHKHFDLMKLPRELRDQIYDEILLQNAGKQIQKAGTICRGVHPGEARFGSELEITLRRTVGTELLLVSKQFSNEIRDHNKGGPMLDVQERICRPGRSKEPLDLPHAVTCTFNHISELRIRLFLFPLTEERGLDRFLMHYEWMVKLVARLPILRCLSVWIVFMLDERTQEEEWKRESLARIQDRFTALPCFENLTVWTDEGYDYPEDAYGSEPMAEYSKETGRIELVHRPATSKGSEVCGRQTPPPQVS